MSLTTLVEPPDSRDLRVLKRRSVPGLSQLRVGTRSSPLALYQTRLFMSLLADAHPLRLAGTELEETAIVTSGDRIQHCRLADLGGKGLFAKEIHDALLDGRIDCAVHSLKDLETDLPPGIVLGCVLRREDPRDALILGPGCGAPDPADPLAALPYGAVIGTSSVRRQSQLLHRRPDLGITLLRGNVQTRLNKVNSGDGADASLLALAGLHRLGLDPATALPLEPELMVPAAGQGIIGITIRAEDAALHDLLAAIEDTEARIVADAERALLAALDGSCRTPIGAYARLLPDDRVHLTGLVARPDGGFLLRRSAQAAAADAERLGTALGLGLRADSPADIFT